MSETEKPRTVWVTKHALTAGIQECPARRTMQAGMIEVTFEGGRKDYMHGNDWHSTRLAAITRANQMRDAKLKSLEKQVERVRKLVF